ncbi:MAG: hypothetical protein ACRD4R_01690 [Candidatus Acidiferrales bacterium]
MKVPSAARWTKELASRLEAPFPRLVRHSIDRMFSGSESAEPGELDLGIGSILALLAAPGAVIALLVSAHYSSLLRFIRGQMVPLDPYTASASDEYFFIALAMAIAGLVAVWKWDRLLPDRRDFVNLAPLPIANRRVFAANLSAIALLALIISIDVNAASCVLFPVLVTAVDSFGVFLNFFYTHALTVLLASAFGFLFVFAVLGSMMATLPFRAFQRLSFYVRCAFILFWAAILSTSESVPLKFPRLADASHAWARVPPPAWFLGLCQSMRGHGEPALISLGGVALAALGVAAVLSLVAFSLSFRRCYLRNAESAGARPSGGPPKFFRWLDRLFLIHPVERAGYRFALKTIARSQEHAFVLGAFGTVAIIWASQAILPVLAPSAPTAAIPSAALLQVPLILGFFMILGFCTAFAMPASLRSNWVFRFHVDPATRNCRSLARKIVLTFLGLALFLPCLLLYWSFWGWQVGLLHAAVVVVWCVLLLEGLLVRFRKIPFTCSLPAFEDHAIVRALLFVLGFFVFTSATASVEHWALGDPILFLVFVPVALGISLAIFRQRESLIESDRRLIFEERAAPVVEAMNLTR